MLLLQDCQWSPALDQRAGSTFSWPERTVEFSSRLRGDKVAPKRNKEGPGEKRGLSCVEKRGE